MKVLSWNCRGLGNSEAVKALKKIVRLTRPDVVFLCETKQMESEMRKIKRRCRFHDFYAEPCVGRKGGLALMWTNDCNVIVKSSDEYHIDAEIEVEELGKTRITGFYGDPEVQRRQFSWAKLKDLSQMSQLPWIVFGDFNEITTDMEKWGGEMRGINQMKRFQDAIEFADLHDLGFRGTWWTWSNRREAKYQVRERLDGFMANTNWMSQFAMADGSLPSSFTLKWNSCSSS